MLYIGNSNDPLIRLSETLDNLRYLDSLPYGANAVFSSCKFAKPISVVPLALTGHEKGLAFSNVGSYVERMNFPHGEEISGYTNDGSTYFPITRADLDGLDCAGTERKLRELSDKYSSLLDRNISDDEFKARIGKNLSKVLISEMIDNIVEHAQADFTFIFSQYYRQLAACEICLADNGRGIFRSLVSSNRMVENDLDAIQQVINRGLSAKDEFGSQHRGTGIRNTIKLLLNRKLRGFFCIISGTAGFYIDSNDRRQFLNLQNFNWNGTIVNMGFQKPQTEFDIYEYLR